MIIKNIKSVFILLISIGTISIFLNSCSKGDSGSNSVTPPVPPVVDACAVGTAGPLYTAVKNLMSANCSSCHTGTTGAGAKDLTTNCNIIANKDRIKIRAVDGNPSFMPQGGKLSAADMKKITDWVNAGGRYSD
jgi:mono/diheme cytochrome c family protein